MSTQVVKHTSRIRSFILNFAESENNLSWPITPENDGVIFEVTGTNISTYTISDVTFGALYGQTKYDTNRIKENELNLSASYSFSESLATSLLYVNVDTETSINGEPDYDKWIATIEYTF